MAELMTHGLTPEQSADVILYWNRGDTERFREFGWNEKISLGYSAVQVASWLSSILPDGSPLLSADEKAAGLHYLELNVNE